MGQYIYSAAEQLHKGADEISNPVGYHIRRCCIKKHVTDRTSGVNRFVIKFLQSVCTFDHPAVRSISSTGSKFPPLQLKQPLVCYAIRKLIYQFLPFPKWILVRWMASRELWTIGCCPEHFFSFFSGVDVCGVAPVICETIVFLTCACTAYFIIVIIVIIVLIITISFPLSSES